MLSRIADSLFWLNRYMERSDGLLRGVKTHYTLLLDKGINENTSWRPLLKVFAAGRAIEADEDDNTMLEKLLIETSNSNSLKTVIQRARENARGVQDHITKEVWEHINQIYLLVNELSTNQKWEDAEWLEVIDTLSNNCILYQGVADATMPRGVGWSFMNVGRHIERTLMTLEMTDSYFREINYNINDDLDILQWRPLLMSLSGYELHLKTYQSNHHTRNTLHQVLFNEQFTRSIFYSLQRVDKYFSIVVRNSSYPGKSALEKHLGRVLSKLKYTDFSYLTPETLPVFLAELRKDIYGFSRELAQHFFSYS